MGFGCSTCGSKWHNAHNCPLKDQKPAKSKGRGKPFEKSKSKGYGKNSGRPYMGKVLEKDKVLERKGSHLREKDMANVASGPMNFRVVSRITIVAPTS